MPESSSALAQLTQSDGTPSPVRLGLASYTFRNFTRAQLIGFMKQLNLTGLNAKDAKDHLPMAPDEEAKALADYAAAGIHLHACGTVYFPKDEDDDIRSKFEYAKRAGIKVIVAGDPLPAALPRIEKFVKEYDIRFAIHNHGPEDKVFPSPLDVLKAVHGMDPRMGCCIDAGHCQLYRQGKPGRRGPGQDAHSRHLRGADQDQVSRLGRSRVRNPSRRSHARRDRKLRLYAWSAGRHGLLKRELINLPFRLQTLLRGLTMTRIPLVQRWAGLRVLTF